MGGDGNHICGNVAGVISVSVQETTSQHLPVPLSVCINLCECQNLPVADMMLVTTKDGY